MNRGEGPLSGQFGWSFGRHQALDQTGTVVGPLLVSGLLFLGRDFRAAFAVLLAPAVVSISPVLAARLSFPRPRDFELAPPPDTPALPPSGSSTRYTASRGSPAAFCSRFFTTSRS